MVHAPFICFSSVVLSHKLECSLKAWIGADGTRHLCRPKSNPLSCHYQGTPWTATQSQLPHP